MAIFNTNKIITRNLKNTSLKKSIEGIMSKCSALNETIFLKANMYGFPYKKGITTNPAIITELSDYLTERGHQVYFGDIIPLKQICWQEYFTNYRLPKHAKFINLNDETDLITIEKGEFRFRFSKVTYYNDIINLPVLKTHSEALLSCAIKNNMGLLPKTADRENTHKIDLNKGISTLYSLVKQNIKYHIVDGIYVMEGNGPVFGDVKYAGIIFAGRSGMSIDSFATSLIDIKNETPRYIERLEQYFIEGDKINLKLRAPDQLDKKYYTGNPTFGEKGVLVAMLSKITDKLGNNINFVFENGKKKRGKINIGININNCDYRLDGYPPSRREIRKVFNIEKK